jgi:putative ABC transport system permease protein
VPSRGFKRFTYDFVSALGLAVDSIRAHKLRSFLTLLGVIIGVASVIFVGSAIEGLSVYAEQSTAKAFGSESFFIGQVITGGTSWKAYVEKLKRNHQMRMDDYNYLRTTDADYSVFSPYRQKSVDVKREGFISEQTSVLGVSAAMSVIRDIGVSDGRFFKINGIDFTVVGVQEKLGSAFGRSQDNSVYIPVTAFNRMYGPPTTDMPIFGRARPESGLSMDQALDYARVALRTRFHQRPAEKDRFDVLTPDAIRGFIDQILSLVAAVVIPITCISLVVGGIVIMNIMLVSVTERTREIGIRKSLGARRSDILLQVLIEAVLMASIGGAMGVGIGALVTAAAGAMFSLKLHITVPYVILSVVVSSLVGIISGWYPASRAAKLDPITALRSE